MHVLGGCCVRWSPGITEATVAARGVKGSNEPPGSDAPSLVTGAGWARASCAAARTRAPRADAQTVNCCWRRAACLRLRWRVQPRRGGRPIPRHRATVLCGPCTVRRRRRIGAAYINNKAPNGPRRTPPPLRTSVPRTLSPPQTRKAEPESLSPSFSFKFSPSRRRCMAGSR